MDEAKQQLVEQAKKAIRDFQHKSLRLDRSYIAEEVYNQLLGMEDYEKNITRFRKAALLLLSTLCKPQVIEVLQKLDGYKDLMQDGSDMLKHLVDFLGSMEDEWEQSVFLEQNLSWFGKTIYTADELIEIRDRYLQMQLPYNDTKEKDLELPVS